MYYFSLVYLILFLGITILAYFLTPLKGRWIVLLAASLVFYIYYTRFFSVFIFITAATIYGAAIWLEKIDGCAAIAKGAIPSEKKAAYRAETIWQKKAVVVLLVVVNFGILTGLKYSGFAFTNINRLLYLLPGNAGFHVWSMILPLGISFYTLQAVGYVVDVYRGKAKANRNFFKVLLFLCFFPQNVEGPIGRYNDLAPQLYEGHRFEYRNFTHGMQLILWGLFKEYVIADRANLLVKKVFGHYGSYSGIAVALAIMVYTFQLYADFSGCIDVATGSAQIFGIRMARNFKRPFFSRSVNEFWRRWHITLGAWLRDYVFYPVSLSKPLMRFSRFIRKKGNSYFGKCAVAGSALFFVWLLMGIWHGAGWKYIVYGMYYYFLMMLGMLLEPAIARVTAAVRIDRGGTPYHLFQIIRTFVLVNIGMLIFRADHLGTAAHMFISMFHGPWASALADGSLLKLGLDSKDFAVLLIGAALFLAVGILQEKGISLRSAIDRWPLPFRWCMYFAGIFAVIILGAYGIGYTPAKMIYASF